MKPQPLLISIALIAALPLVAGAQDLPPPTNYWAENADYQQLLTRPVTPLNSTAEPDAKYPRLAKKVGLPVFVGPVGIDELRFQTTCHFNPVKPPHRFDSDNVRGRRGVYNLQPGFAIIDDYTYYDQWPHTVQGLATYTFHTPGERTHTDFVIR